MSVAGEANEDGGSDGGSEPTTELEGDVPKPAFELPAPSESGDEPAPAGDTKTGKQRRQERAENFRQEATRFRAEAAEERKERQRLSEQIAEMRGRLDAQQQARPDADPYQAKLATVAAKIEKTLARMGGGDAGAVEEWHALRREETELISERREEARAKQAAANAPGPVDPVLASVRARYDWLGTDPDAQAVAEGIVRKLVRLEKRDMSNPAIRKATLMQAAAETERELGIGGGGTEPTDTQRERYRGLGGQSSGAGRTGKTVVSLTGDQKAQAEALFRNLDPEAAHKKWWDAVGQRIANKQER